METTLVDDKKVEALVERTVQKHFKLAFENVEEVRKSPAVTLIRLEDRLNSLEARIERDMVTKAEHASLRAELKEEISNTRTELKDEIWKQRLLIIFIGVLIVLTNPKVLELIGKLFSAFKP
jgi:hypothetical protein